MKSKMSFFNTGIQKQNAKQHGWIGLIFLIGWLFILPLRMILLAEDEKPQLSDINNMYDVTQEPQLLLMAGIPVIAAIFLFRYLQVPEAADMMHSLPAKRESLLINQLASGIIMLVVPIFITAAAVSFVSGSYPLYNNVTGADIWSWAGITILMSLFFFLFTVFVGMVTGVSVATGILTFILLMLPLGLSALIRGNLALYLYGFPSVYENTDQVAQWSPIVVFTELGNKGMDMWQVTGFIAGAVISAIAALVLYRYRHIETASQTITFTALRPIFKYGVTFCMMLTGGLYYNQYGSFNWIFFGYIFGSIVGYLIAEMILKKTWRVFRGKLVLGYAGFAVVIVFLGILVRFDAFGFESTVPETENIEGVYFGSNVYDLQNAENRNQDIYGNSASYIEKVRQLHQAIVEERPEEMSGSTRQGDNILISYQLKNGGKTTRQYEQLSTANLKEEMAAVMDQDTYKSQRFQLDRLQEPVVGVDFRPNGPGGNTSLTVTDTDEIEELKEIMKYELTSMSYDQLVNLDREWGNIRFRLLRNEENEGRYTFELPYHKSFHEVDTWLENNGYLEEARVTIDDVEEMHVLHVPGGGSRTKPAGEIFDEQKEDAVVADVESNEAKNSIFQNYSSYGDGEYIAQIVTTDNEPIYGYLQKEQMPDDVLSQLD